MSREVLLVVPEAPAPQTEAAGEQRNISGRPLRFGVLDNSKSNADHLLKMIIEGVKAAIPGATVVETRKPHSSMPADKSVIDRLEQEADCVIAAMAD